MTMVATRGSEIKIIIAKFHFTNNALVIIVPFRLICQIKKKEH